MILKSEFNIFIKTILTVFLMMPSMSVQAQNSIAGAETTNKEPSSATDNQQHAFNFPRWPDSRPVYRQRIPLAPPGPYMSSALSEFSFDRSSYGRDRGRSGIRNESSEMQMQPFNPNMAWPNHARRHNPGYSRAPVDLPESGLENVSAGEPGPDQKLTDRKWPDHKWPDWPDNGSNTSWPEGNKKNDDWPQEWAQKWPSVTRHDDNWSSNRRSDDKWSNSRWPYDKWPDSRKSDNKWPDNQSEQHDPVIPVR